MKGKICQQNNNDLREGRYMSYTSFKICFGHNVNRLEENMSMNT